LSTSQIQHKFIRKIEDEKPGFSKDLIKFGSIQETCRTKFEKCLENPYVKLLRLDKPLPSFLLFWPCGWGITLAADPGCWPDLYILSLALTGSIVVRTAGCVLNDMWDKKIDNKVERTRSRPLASGELSMGDAFSCFMGVAGVGYLLLLAVNFKTVILANGILGLAITYPLMKRITYWPQFVLGMVLNYGALLGWCAVKNDVLWSACLPLYAAGICWTIIYDTIYSRQDIKDDLKIGVKSTAILFGPDIKKWLTGFSTAMVSGLVTSGIVCDQTWPYYAAVSIAGAHFATQVS
jgi:4-hydroxybenzoate polyprenyltransferase